MRGILAGLIWCCMASLATAQGALPGARFDVIRDMDFYGSDLDPIFDTTLERCRTACAQDSACTAMTYNTRSRACFPKRGVKEERPYAGAISARRISIDPALNGLAARNVDGLLSGLKDVDFNAARALAQVIGFDHPSNGANTGEMRRAAQARRDNRDIAGASRWSGAAAARSDLSSDWTAYAADLLALPRKNYRARRDAEARALSAAINAAIRAPQASARADAAQVLADALERSERGRDAIPVLRFTAIETGRADLADALDRMIAKHGFRVIGTKVESDLAAPRICVEFSEPLAQGAARRIADFVQMPQSGLAVEAEETQLCISGVIHGARYSFRLREGLPAQSGERLHKGVALTLYVRDRAQSVRFPGRNYVLPRLADTALPVVSVNTRALDLELQRVSERNLLRAVQDGYFAQPLSRWQQQRFSTDLAEQVWTGSAVLEPQLNRDVTTRLPMNEALAGRPAGIYVLSATIPGTDPYKVPVATQWFVLSDLGLSTALGTGGMDVSVRGLSDAQARDGVELTLVSRANAVLGTARSDARGMAQFAPGLVTGQGAAAPALLLAQSSGGDDLGFLALTGPAFDLSDRGVEGRAPAGPVDVFATADRGAYRAGETIRLTALLRGETARALPDVPLTATLRRPDGVEHSRRVSDGARAGGHVFALPLGASVPRGTWRVELRVDPASLPLATVQVLVEDFLPERVDFAMTLPDGPLHPDRAAQVQISARYLFGAPAGNLPLSGDMTLRPERGIEGWPGWVFGRHNAPELPARTPLGPVTTDAAGQAAVTLPVPASRGAARPLRAELTLRIREGSGRPVERQTSRALRPGGPMIGLRPLFEQAAPERGEAAFEVIALTPDAVPRDMPVRWVLNRIETRYEWYRLYGDWKWEPVTTRKRVAAGDTALRADGPARIAPQVEWGRYELIVEAADGQEAITSEAFTAGWNVPADTSETPDRLEIALDQSRYAIGDTAQLRIVARDPGTVLVQVMGERVLAQQVIEVAEGETRLPLRVDAAWGTGAYVVATHLRGMDRGTRHNPARAIGIAHVAIDPGAKRLAVTLDAPDMTRPRGPLKVRARITGAAEGAPVWLTLAAVDVGILNLTGFQTPDPAAHYFGQRRLGMEIRDVYGRLIDGMNGAMGQVRSGGDANAGLRRQSPPPTQDLLALYRGPVAVLPDGMAEVTFDLPAFNGTVRLMAVAWSREAVGAASRDVLVRDPVVISPSLPRFLAPGDEGTLRLELSHRSGPAGRIGIALQSGPELSLHRHQSEITLDEGATTSLSVPITALRIGDPVIAVSVTLPDGEVLHQELRMPVRANDPAIAATRRLTLAPGETLNLDRALLSGLREGSGAITVSAGAFARLDVAGTLMALGRTPYGCTEQVTSQAMPLLYLASLAQTARLPRGAEPGDAIADAIGQVLARQTASGGFGLWRAEAGDFWLDAYVTDFLSRARALGHDVPARAWASAMDNLRNRIGFAPDFDNGGEDIAYALMVLAREGAAAMGDLRYYADVKRDAFATPLAQAQLGAALAAYGDTVRADAMFAGAADRIARIPDRETPVWRDDFGSTRRDVAGVLALAAESGSLAVDRAALSARLAAAGGGRLSTQEANWTLLAAHALGQGDAALRLDGRASAGPVLHLDAAALASGPRQIAAVGTAATELTLTTFGVPQSAPDPGGTGYAIRRALFDLEGAPLDPGNLRTGERFAVVLTVLPSDASGGRLMIDDPLPAGVEIDNPALLRAGDVRALDWLDVAPAEHSEFRSDRFLAAVDLRDGKTVQLAYIARAVTPGRYRHPAASVEDMYRPQYRARGKTGEVVIAQ